MHWRTYAFAMKQVLLQSYAFKMHKEITPASCLHLLSCPTLHVNQELSACSLPSKLLAGTLEKFVLITNFCWLCFQAPDSMQLQQMCMSNDG